MTRYPRLTLLSVHFDHYIALLCGQVIVVKMERA